MKQLYVFSATWCGPCQMLKKVIDDADLWDFNLVRVDVDEWQELTKEHEVRSVPTLILKKDGVEVARKTGYMSKHALLNFVEQ